MFTPIICFSTTTNKKQNNKTERTKVRDECSPDPIEKKVCQRHKFADPSARIPALRTFSRPVRGALPIQDTVRTVRADGTREEPQE